MTCLRCSVAGTLCEKGQLKSTPGLHVGGSSNKRNKHVAFLAIKSQEVIRCNKD